MKIAAVKGYEIISSKLTHITEIPKVGDRKKTLINC